MEVVRVNTFVCPGCGKALSRRRSRYGLLWVCTSCNGRAVTLQMLRKMVSRPVVNQLWQKVQAEGNAHRRDCPGCRRKMTQVTVRTGRLTEEIDVCRGCYFVWFDHRELESLPGNRTRPPQDRGRDEDAASMRRLPLEAREAVARARLETVKAQQAREAEADTAPEEWWHVLIGYLGVPIEYNDTPLQGRPWLTWLLTAAIAAVSLLAFRHLEAAVTNWGLVPAQFARHFGLTFITSFFLHGGFAHLLGNLYFLWIFGDNTEDVLGKGRYLLLIALAALAGDILHIVTQPDSTIPMIGASGGISGILAYYCLRFPRATIGMVIYFHWVRIPVWAMFGIWVVFQFIEAYRQHAGLSNVAAFAHLGGAAVGVLFWLLTRASLARAAN